MKGKSTRFHYEKVGEKTKNDRTYQQLEVNETTYNVNEIIRSIILSGDNNGQRS